jgi:hypothetical protein
MPLAGLVKTEPLLQEILDKQLDEGDSSNAFMDSSSTVGNPVSFTYIILIIEVLWIYIRRTRLLIKIPAGYMQDPPLER